MPSSYNLGPRYEALVRDLVASGRYANASEVVRDAMRLMEEKEELRQARIEAMRQIVREGIESGPGVPAEIAFDQLESRWRERR